MAKKKSEIDVNNMTLLYPSGPLRDYMACLEEITPEKNYAHKINITKLLKRLLQKYSGLKVLYKTFPGIDSCNDPFMEILSTVSAVKVPRLVIFVCAAVASVPVIVPLAVRVPVTETPPDAVASLTELS